MCRRITLYNNETSRFPCRLLPVPHSCAAHKVSICAILKYGWFANLDLHLCVSHFLQISQLANIFKSGVRYLHQATHLLQLEDPIHKSFRRRWASRDVNIHWHDTITAPYHAIAVMVVPAAICAAAHRNNPSRVRHLVVDLTQRRSHLIRECAGHDHHVGLARGGTENYTEAILIVTGRREMHHFDGAAGQAEGHRPE